jgi:pyruvate dehydrogenase E1 component
MVSKLGEVMWVVDLNRQSLDRVVPDIAAGRLMAMFEAAGWQTIAVKYGRRLNGLFARPGGDALRERIDLMPNEEYQRLLRLEAGELRSRLTGGDGAIERVVGELDDDALAASFRDLGGHDLGALLDAYRAADAEVGRPSVVFAYTLKGWNLPTEGHPANHSALLTVPQFSELAGKLGADANEPWAPFPADSAEARLCAGAGARLGRPGPQWVHDPPDVPAELSRDHATGRESTQQAFGRFFVDLTHEAPEVAKRVVTVSPDVGTSTNLGGWINKVGIWAIGERIDWFADDTDTLVRWRESDHGQHIELGIAEVNLVGMLGELGATWSRAGQPLLPVGTIYDPFVSRALEPWSFGVYAGGQSILVGTPSGVTLGPEGGAHQSVTTPSIGLEQPGVVAWEPAFGQDFEWTFLHALSRLGRDGGTASYFRLSTRPVDQSLAGVPADEAARSERRRQAIRGGYRLRAPADADVAIAVMGALVPEACAAAGILEREAGVASEIVVVTSADLLFRAFQARSGLARGEHAILDELFPRALPLVTLLDGHPHTLTFLGAIRSVPVTSLGVQRFGQAGDIAELYAHHEIDAESVVGAALDLLDP